MKRKWFHNLNERISSSYILKILVLFCSYFIFGQLGFVAQDLIGTKTQIWPATGAAFAIILLWGISLWPAVVLATLLLSLLNPNKDISLTTQVVSNCVEVLVSVYFCLRSDDFHKSLDRMKDVFRLIQSALLSGLVGLAIVFLSLLSTDFQKIEVSSLLHYWAGRSIGLFMIAPLLLTLLVPGPESKLKWRKFNRVELFSYSSLFLSLIFILILFRLPLRFYFYFPLILWPALRLGQKGVSLIVFFVTLALIYEAVTGSFRVIGTINISDENYIFILVVLFQITGLMISAATTEREIEYGDKENKMKILFSEIENKLSILKKEKEAAESRSEMKTQFLTNVGHEIRTPLAAILGFTELLASENMIEEEMKKKIEVIKRNGLQLLNVVNDVLDISKIESGQFEIQKTGVILKEVVEDVKSLLKPEVIKKGLVFKIESESNIPQKVLTDPLRLRQILINVIGNAIKFTEYGSVVIKIKTIIDHNGLNKLAFIISDTGVGMPADLLKNVFLPFMHLSPVPTRRFGGTGLGLALSQRLARTLGGDIVLTKSNLGEGSEFIVTIDPGDAEQIAKSEKQQKDAESEVTKLNDPKILVGKKILVVDDDLDNQTLIRHYLVTAGATVSVANNGVEALQKVHENHFDIILTDLLMPVLDGYELVKSLRKDGYKKNIIALTAFELKEVRERCLASGFNDCITKPIDRINLIQFLVKKMAS